MSYVVRHKDTGNYLQGQNQWTNNLGSALQFSSGITLVRYIEAGAVQISPDALEVLVVPGGVPSFSSAQPTA